LHPQESLPLLLPHRQLIRRIQISQSQQPPLLLPPRIPLPQSFPQPPPQNKSRRIIHIQLLLPPKTLEPQPQPQLPEVKLLILNASKIEVLFMMYCMHRGLSMFLLLEIISIKVILQDIEKHLHKLQDIVKCI